MKDKIIIVIVSLISILGITGLIFISHKISVKETFLDKVKLKEKTNTNESFAIMLEQDDGTYIQSSESSFPTNMAYNSELSGCIDNNGNKLNGALSYDVDTNLVSITTSSTTYCYLYFDEYTTILNICNINDSLSDCLVSNAYIIKDLWNSPLEDDGYRFVGTEPDNYICFGTSDKDECVNDADKYMYRIIGIFKDENGEDHLKLIKKDSLDTKYAWHSDYSSDTAWNESDLYKGLNGNYFLTNSSYSYMQDETWTNKISTWNYTMTNTLKEIKNKNGLYGLYYYYNTGQTVYLHELNRGSKLNKTCYFRGSIIADCSAGTWETATAKIGLMYASDYALSLGKVALNYTSNTDFGNMKTGWLNINHNDLRYYSYEWTMSRDGLGSTGDYYAIGIFGPGDINQGYTSNSYLVRPTFYLETYVKYKGGTGTTDNPIMIVE